MDAIKFAPSEGLSYNLNEEKYWNREALRKEIDRTFEICNSCRMCFKFCDTFPSIFDLIDKDDLTIPEFTEKNISDVADLCFQCKICYFKCPYTKDDNHEFNLDFPRLILRYNAIQTKEKGVPLRDKLLGNPDLLGKIGCSTSSLANWANNFKPNRLIMESVIGIHRDKKLPTFASQTFFNWFIKRLLFRYNP